MRSTAIGNLVHLSARAAVARTFDERNFSTLRWVLLALTPPAVAVGSVLFAHGRIWHALTWLPVVLLASWIFFTRASAFFERYGRQMTIVYLAVLAAAIAISTPEPDAACALAGFVLPTFLLFLRLNWTEYLVLAAVDLGAVGWALFRSGMPESLSARVGMATTATLFVLIVLAISNSITRRSQDHFLVDWRREVARDREQKRMRSELEDAREVQLSMLPSGTPDLGWLDFSSVSLPASEVGGDYFDYFELSGSRLAVVIGDVAGHGMASGLVLSGVRSSLHLLQDELSRPVEVLERLDRMLHATVGGRLFVTFQIAVLDPALGRISVANAGHPPLFLASDGGSVSRLGADSLPLGTRLRGEYSEQTAALGSGDRVLLFSDGVHELRNLHGEPFGERRLLEALRQSRADADARRTRDGVLNTISRFKGDAEQDDDMTLVALRIGDLRRLQ